jgi:hypothetical protein
VWCGVGCGFVGFLVFEVFAPRVVESKLLFFVGVGVWGLRCCAFFVYTPLYIGSLNSPAQKRCEIDPL